MKILTLSNLYPPDIIGGYEVACRQVVEGLIDRGHDVLVLTSAPRQPVDRVEHVDRRLRLADEWNANAMGFYSITHLTTHAHSRFIDAHNVHELLDVIVTFDPDVAYLGNLAGIGGLGLLATLQQSSIPWCWQLGDCIPTRLCSSRNGLIPELADDFSRRFHGTYIAVSHQVRGEIESSGIALRGRVERLPYWVTGERPAERSYFKPGHKLRVMAAGAINRDKGIDILIEAIARLRDEGIDAIEVDLYGKVGDATLTEMIPKLDLGDRVRMMGPRPHTELLRLYEQYDVFAFPTQSREPFGIVALEAASRGCVPVVTSDCGFAEWFEHGVHVLKADRDADSLAEAIGAIAAGDIELEPIANRGLDLVWNDFHLDSVLPQLEAILEETAANPSYRSCKIPSGEVYRMARMAERLAESLIGEAMGAR